MTGSRSFSDFNIVRVQESGSRLYNAVRAFPRASQRRNVIVPGARAQINRGEGKFRGWYKERIACSRPFTRTCARAHK